MCPEPASTKRRGPWNWWVIFQTLCGGAIWSSRPQSVWKITHQFQGPLRFVLAGSGHIAGVVNPPAAHKYHYWTNEQKVDTLADFLAGAQESKGSWWPDWLQWIDRKSDSKVPAAGARIPGKGKLKALTDAPGRYVREH